MLSGGPHPGGGMPGGHMGGGPLIPTESSKLDNRQEEVSYIVQSFLPLGLLKVLC